MSTDVVVRPASLRWRVGRGPGVARPLGGVLLAVAVGLVLGYVLITVALAVHPAVIVVVPVLGGVLVAGLRRPVWALLPFLAALPASAVEVAGVGAIQLGATATVGLALGLRLLRGERVLEPMPHIGWLVAMWGVLLVSAATGAAPDIGVSIIVLFGTGIALVAVVGSVTASPDDLRLALALLLAVTGAMCAFAALGAGSVEVYYGGSVIEGRSQGTFSQPNELGTFAGMTTLLAIGCLASGVRRLRLPAGVAAVAGIAAVAASLSRGAWIGMALALVGVVVLRPDARRFVAGSLVGVVVSVVVAVSLAPELPQVEVLQSRLESLADPAANPYDERPAIYREALRQIRTAPWLGNGPGAFPVVAARQLENGSRLAPSHAHNTLLVAASEGGLVTAGLLVAMTMALVRAARRRVAAFRGARGAPEVRVREGAILGASGALVVVVGQGLVDFPLRNPTLLFVVLTVLGLLFSALRGRA